MKRTDCQQCLSLGRTAPKVRCATCHYCKEHPGCHCVMCSICRKRVAPTAVCRRSGCNKCKAHHVELIRGDFPFRKCEMLGATKPPCVCHGYADYTPCKTCKQCVRHRCDCPPTFAINPLQRTIGCELEIAEYHGFSDEVLNKIPIGYTFDHDGSVRPSQRELVTARMIGDKVPRAMAAIADELARFGASVNDSCGFHVHVDALHESPADLRRILVAFKLFQDEIFGTLVDGDRRHNVYCPPLALDEPEIFDLMKLDGNAAINDWFHRYLYGMAIPNIGPDYTALERRQAMRSFEEKLKAKKAHKYENGARRSAINFHSWMMRGTVEFRLKEGSVSKPDLVNWPLWCGWFVQKISGATDKEVMWWMKKPPSLLELSERFTASSLGGARMPKSVLEWVESKVAEAKKPGVKKKLARAPGPETAPRLRGFDSVLDSMPIPNNPINRWRQATAPDFQAMEERARARAQQILNGSFNQPILFGTTPAAPPPAGMGVPEPPSNGRDFEDFDYEPDEPSF